jgi:probable phosphoglycerate mutase
MSPELYVLRHGETTWNREGRIQGHLNAPLTPLGVTQAQAQHRIMAACDLGGVQVLSSPSGRAVQTAGLALGPLITEITTEPDLREIGMGEWAGRLRSELAHQPSWEETPDGVLELYDMAPGGEGLAGLEVRCAGLLARLEGPHVLVTHGITSRMIRCLALGHGPRVSLGALRDIPGGQGVVYHIKDGRQRRLG